MTFCTGFMVQDGVHDGVQDAMQSRGRRVQYSGYRMQGTGFRVRDAGCRIRGTGFMMQGKGCVANDLGSDLYPTLTFDEAMKIVGGSRFKDNVSWE